MKNWKIYRKQTTFAWTIFVTIIVSFDFGAYQRNSNYLLSDFGASRSFYSSVGSPNSIGYCNWPPRCNRSVFRGTVITEKQEDKLPWNYHGFMWNSRGQFVTNISVITLDRMIVKNVSVGNVFLSPCFYTAVGNAC